MKQKKQLVDPICPLGQRPIPTGAPKSHHHLIPKLSGGKGGSNVLLNQCHEEVHAPIGEGELVRIFSTPDEPKNIRIWHNLLLG